MANEKIPEEFWNLMKQHLGYSDEELELFKKQPRNRKVLRTAPDMKDKTIVFEVVQSQGCNSQHSAGTRFYFSGDGNLISKMAPAKVCAFALPVMTQTIFAIQELWYAGVDPNELCFNRCGCFDVGVRCGGWGHIVLEAKVITKQQAKELKKQTG